jgi:hypothetical protein
MAVDGMTKSEIAAAYHAVDTVTGALRYAA